MTSRWSRSLVLGLSLASLSFSLPAGSSPFRQTDSQLIAHEWGTLTSVAGRDGRAIRWHPRSGPDDLPRFIEHYSPLISKRALQGTIRMETPVLYFYSPTRTTVSVKVRFAKGVITEWFPHASDVEPDPKVVLDDMALYHHHAEGAITWDSVTVDPGLTPGFPTDRSRSQYYAARETAATPVLVSKGGSTQQEKFLFYRGVSAFDVPVSAQVTQDGGVRIKNLGQDYSPSVILFERRGDQMGYRLAGSVTSEAMVERPELTSTRESLSQDLEEVLTTQGLYPDEAHAMVETWRHSWFEEGSRLFYIVPARFLDSILPLSISPAPSQTLRVFVGRIELITPATERAVLDALAGHDLSVVTKYGRFLEPILDQLKAEDPARAPELEKELSDTYNTTPSQSR
jgi:hypothetical protein